MIEEKLHNLIEQLIAEDSVELVQVKIMGAPKKGKTLQIMAEKDDGTPLTIRELGQVSRKISNMLDEDEDIIEGNFYLEVSSPGIDRPLVKQKDFQKYVGYLINLRLIAANDKGRKFKGTIISADGDNLIFKPENFEEEFKINFLNIDSAKLVLTDDLLKAKQQK